jgi:CheY-like chemotaxis protein
MTTQQRRALEGLYVLLVEDSGVTALNTLRVLQERGGAIVEICTSIGTAKERIEAARFDLVILDYGLGGGERGVHLAHSLMHHEREKIRQIVRISYSGAEPEIILRDVPADDAKTIFATMLTKPVPLRELIDILQATAELHGKI